MRRQEIEGILQHFAGEIGMGELDFGVEGIAAIEVAGLPFVLEILDDPLPGVLVTVRVAEIPPDDPSISGFLLQNAYPVWFKAGVTLSLSEDGADAEGSLMLPLQLIAPDTLLVTIEMMAELSLTLQKAMETAMHPPASTDVTTSSEPGASIRG